MNNNSENSNNMVDITVSVDESKEILFYDNISDRFFLSTIENLNEAVTKLNERLMEESLIHLKFSKEYYPELIPTFISLNDFYAEIDLLPLSFGDNHGLLIYDGEQLEITYSLHTPISDDSFCLAIDLKCVSEKGGAGVYAKRISYKNILN